jgi:nucleotidyltransferase/DNA polymerase involved in DNA repair
MFATIYLPNFYLQAAIRHQPELFTKPVALLDDQEAKSVIVQLNQIAENVGVSKGMTASQGLARCLQLVIKTRMRTQEKLLDDIMLQHAYTLTPYLEATGPGVCTVQFTDPRNLEAKVFQVIERLADSAIVAQAGIAGTPDTSFLAAHLAKPVLQINDAKEFLSPLPIKTLQLAM